MIQRRWIWVLIALLVVGNIQLFLLHHAQKDTASEDGSSSQGSSTPAMLADVQPIAGLSQQPSLETSVTLVLRDFEEWNNNIKGVVDAFRKLYPNLEILVIGDRIPYPPLEVPKDDKHLRIASLGFPLDKNRESALPDLQITTPLALLLPDNTAPAKALEDVFLSFTRVHQGRAGESSPNDPILPRLATFPVEPLAEIGKSASRLFLGEAHCYSAAFDLKSWTLSLGELPLPLGADGQRQSDDAPRQCDFVSGPVGLLMWTSDLRQLSWPSYRPTASGVLLQGVLRGWPVLHHPASRFRAPRLGVLFADSHGVEKHIRAQTKREHALLSLFGIKLIRFPGSQTEEEWHGCSRNTERCFGTVKGDTPEYIFAGRYTPPCCLRNIRETARYVFKTLEKAGVRYWLEGGSLLGAARHGDLIPWDYDVDIGVYLDDIPKCPELASVHGKGEGAQAVFEGFVWEKAREGDFYRVQYSQYNHLHVDIFPFYEKDGVMTKNTWFETHRQDTEFPAHYLKPLEKMSFVGRQVSVPNHYREFLELKFGEGVIEHPRLPQSTK